MSNQTENKKSLTARDVAYGSAVAFGVTLVTASLMRAPRLLTDILLAAQMVALAAGLGIDGTNKIKGAMNKKKEAQGSTNYLANQGSGRE